jgi:hypothetical protein
MNEIRLHKKDTLCFRVSEYTNLFLDTFGMIFISNSQYYFQRQVIRWVLPIFARILEQMRVSHWARIYYLPSLLTLKLFAAHENEKY